MMPFQEFSPPLGARTILLSIKPIYSDLIAAGEKRVEFRRSWASEEVGLIAIYASSPIQRIVGVVEVEEVVKASPTKLWSLSASRGRGLTKVTFKEYFDGKENGYAILLGKVHKLKNPLTPSAVVHNFSPPQSFRYLTATELKRLVKHLPSKKEET